MIVARVWCVKATISHCSHDVSSSIFRFSMDRLRANANFSSTENNSGRIQTVVDRKNTMAPSGRGGSLPYSEGHVWVVSSITALYMSLLLHISKERNKSGIHKGLHVRELFSFTSMQENIRSESVSEEKVGQALILQPISRDYVGPWATTSTLLLYSLSQLLASTNMLLLTPPDPVQSPHSTLDDIGASSLAFHYPSHPL